MKKLLMLAALAAIAAGCSMTKINYEKDDKGAVSYCIYHNDHWLKTDAAGLKGGMTKDGAFEVSADGLKTSPSEEFNKTMKTYTAAVVDIAQLAAAAYNPSSSAAVNTSRRAAETQSVLDAGGIPQTPSAQPTPENLSASAPLREANTTTNVADCAECEAK